MRSPYLTLKWGLTSPGPQQRSPYRNLRIQVALLAKANQRSAEQPSQHGWVAIGLLEGKPHSFVKALEGCFVVHLCAYFHSWFHPKSESP